MANNPQHWEKYYSANPQVCSFQRKYNFLDRCRYYWSYPAVGNSLNKLINNLSGISIPLSLISQYLPGQFVKVKESIIKDHPQSLILGKITDVLNSYLYACGIQQ